MSHIFYWGMWIAVGAFALSLLAKPFVFYLLLPIILRFRQTHNVESPRYVANLDEMSPEAREHLEMILGQFREQGFEPIGPPMTSNSTGKVSAVQTILVNSAGDVAELLSTAAQGNSFIRSQGFIIGSKFADGKEVVTISNRTPNIFPPNAAVYAVNFSWVKDTHTLCEAHRRRLQRLGLTDRPRIAPKAGEQEAYVREETRGEMNRVASRGYFYFDKKAGLYRQTWKEAFLMAWKMAPPIKDWRLRRRDRRAQRVWHELGMHQWKLQLPSADAGAESTAATAGIGYEPQLREGEIHTHSVGGVLTVRIGMESRGQYFSRQWLTYLVLVVISASTALWGYLYILGTVSKRQFYQVSLFNYLGIAFLFFNITTLILGAIRRRGTVVLVASPRGLTYRNIPALRGDGTMAREDVEALSVVIYELGLRRRYQLIGGRLTGSHLTLAVAKDKKELERLRDLLAEALGIRQQQQASTATT